MSAATLTSVSDGFMLNLGAVLLQLCQPFCTSAEDPKALKIDPTYGAVPVSNFYNITKRIFVVGLVVRIFCYKSKIN